MNKIIQLIFQKKKVLVDFLLNFIASLLTTGITQLLLFPWLSRIMSEEKYGLVLAIMGVVNTITGTVGGSLNNTRLIVNSEYDGNAMKGDFNLLLIFLSLLGLIAFLAYLFYQHIFGFTIVLLLSILILAASFRNYGTVFYRLSLNYKKILLSSVIISAGSIAGMMIIYYFELSDLWYFPFLLGEIFGIVYILLSTKVLREGCKFTKMKNRVIKIEIVLLTTTLLSNVLTYLDRLVLLPLLGGEAVSIYTVASFLGKSFGTIMLPLAGVLLSYYAQKNYIMTKSKYWKINLMMFGLGIPFFLISIFLSPVVTRWFYPTIVDDAIKYMVLANSSAIILTIANMTQPAVLKYASIKWQIIIQLIYAILYLGFGYFGSKLYGLMGFAVAALFASVIRLLVLYLVGHVAISKTKNLEDLVEND